MHPAPKRLAILMLCGLAALCALPSWSQSPDKIFISDPVVPSVYGGDLRDVPPVKSWSPGDPIKDIPRRHNGTPSVLVPADPPLDGDPLLDQQDAVGHLGPALALVTTPNLNLAGQGFIGVNPPDTVGDVDFFVTSTTLKVPNRLFGPEDIVLAR